MKFKKTLISVAVAVVLSGCSSDDNDSPQQDPVEKNSLVCLDANANAKCDAGETSEKVITWSDSAVSTTLTSSAVALAYEGDDGLAFTAPAGSAEVSPATTLLTSELIYNQIIDSKTTVAVDSYLNTKLGGALSAAHQKDFATALKAAFDANPAADRYAVIAAVTNKAVALGADGLENITVNAADITAADLPSLSELAITESLSKNVDDTITQQDVDGWIHAGDASISVLTAANGKVIGGHHYHNALTVIDVATGSVTYTPVSTISDSGHGVDSSTGASENYLREVTANADGSYVYVNIPPKNLSSSSADEGTYGLYKIKLEADDSIATVVDATGLMHTVDETNSKRLAVKLKAFAVSQDDSQVATYDGDEFLTVYDGDLSNPGASVLIEGIQAFAVSANTAFVVTNNAEDITKGDIALLAVDTLTGTETITLDFVPQELRLNIDASKLVAFNHGHDNNGTMTIAVIDLADNSVIDTGVVAVTSDTAAVSPDFSRMAIVGHEENRLLIVNLTVPDFSVQNVRDLAYNARDVAFISNSQLAITNERNSMAVLDIATTTDNISLAAKTQLALGGLNRASINGGGYFDAVITDVTLSKKFENVAISWSADSSLSTNLDAADGSIVRPAADAVDVAGVLTANTSVSFRDDTVEGSKNFDLTLRKIPAPLPAAAIVQTASNSAQYMAANYEGDIMVAPVRFENTNGDRVYGFNALNMVAGQPVITTGTADTPKTYLDTETLVGVGIIEKPGQAYALGVSASVGETGQARIFTVAMDATGLMADVETNAVDIGAGSPLKVGLNSAQTLAGVMVGFEDGSFITEIYSFSDTGVVTLDKTINMTAAEYKSYGPPAINDDASRVYQRDGDNVIMTSADGSTTATAAVEEIARVWYYNGRVFVNTYDGNIVSFNDSLEESSRLIFSTGTGGRMYGGVGREFNGTDYLYIPLQQASDIDSNRESDLNGIYQLEILADGSLKEIAFSKKVEGADRMAVSGDGGTVFFSYRDRSGDDAGYWLGAVELELSK